MAKTLADMTAKERADCVGMWALIEGVNLAVIAEADETNTCVVVYPQWDGNSAVHLNEMVTPRFDLPRAWTPDGEPEPAQALADETWEYAVAFKSTNGMGYLDRSGNPQPWPCLTAWYLTKEIAQVALMNSEYRKETLCTVRRRVSPPEVIND